MGKFLFNNSIFYRSLRHSLFFVLSVLLFSIIVFSRAGKDDFWQSLLITSMNAVFFFAYGYLTIFVLVPQILFKRFFLLFVLSFIVCGLLLSFLKFSFSGYVFAASISPGSVDNVPIAGWRSLLINTKDMSFIVAVFAVAKFSKDWLFAEHQRKLVESKNAEARLKVLQSHFDPHFLFNTLNNLYALSLKKSNQTVVIIKKLRTVLKYLLVDYQGANVVLDEEVKLIENYLSIEQIRYGKRLKASFIVEIDECSSKIAPMLFYPIIENCFKHGSAIDAGSPWIKLRLVCKNNFLSFSARNSKPVRPSSSSKKEAGEGLLNLERRLELIYPGNYFFKYEDLNDEYNVYLEIKLR